MKKIVFLMIFMLLLSSMVAWGSDLFRFSGRILNSSNNDPDSDNDGICDLDDLCPDTVIGKEVDVAGCSAFQFCSSFEIGSKSSRKTCNGADWKDNEIWPRDCKVKGRTCIGRRGAD